jgi:hypothetical protein
MVSALVDEGLVKRAEDKNDGRGVLSFNVDNAFDEDFHFQDVDPENPSIMPERMAYLRFTLALD